MHPVRHIRALVLTAAGAAFLPGSLPAQTAPAPIFENGQAQVVPAFADSSAWIREELYVETEFDSDGDGTRDRVRVAVVRPGPTAEGLKVPVVYESSPYYSGTSGVGPFFWDPRQELDGDPNPRNPHPPAPHRPRPGISGSHVGDWVPRGFAVVHSEAPGTGLSQGCPTIGGDPEALAPKAVIDWLNGRAKGYTTVDGMEEVSAEWSTGRVGMTGTSYNGTIPFAAATTGVEGLEAIIPVAPNTSYYRYYRANGLVRSPGGYVGEDMDVLYDFVHSQDPARRAWCDDNVRDGELKAMQDRVTGDWSAFWEDRDFMVRTENVKAAVLMAHAFNDWNVMPEHSVRVYEALKASGVPAMAYFHQGGHGGPPPFELMNLWFTRYLYGVENGVEELPKAWIVREGAERTDPTPYRDYPNPDAAPATLRLTAGGVQQGGLALEPAPGQGTETLEDNFSFSGRTLATAEWSDHRLLYVTPELQEDLHLSGWPSVTLRIAADAPAANLSVWLVALPWTEGRSPSGGVVTRGWADLRNHRSLTGAAPADPEAAALARATDHRSFTSQESLVPGEFYEVTFHLNPDDQVIPAGERLGLLVFSSDREFTLRPDPGVRLTLDLDETRLTLPVVGGDEALRQALGGG